MFWGISLEFLFSMDVAVVVISFLSCSLSLCLSIVCHCTTTYVRHLTVENHTIGHVSKVYFTVRPPFIRWTFVSCICHWTNGVNRFGVRENRHFLSDGITRSHYLTAFCCKKATVFSAHSFTHLIFFYCRTFVLVLLQIMNVFFFFADQLLGIGFASKCIHNMAARNHLPGIRGGNSKVKFSRVPKTRKCRRPTRPMWFNEMQRERFRTAKLTSWTSCVCE